MRRDLLLCGVAGRLLLAAVASSLLWLGLYLVAS